MDVARLERIQSAILSRSTGKGSRIHGPPHWAGVAAAGLSLLDRTGADPLVVLLFALFHDSMRESDGYDPEHGARAARLAREMRDELQLDDERLEVLEEACRYHDKGATSTDATIGACWDADRMNLRRVRIEPAARFMSTEAGRAHVGTSRIRYFSWFKFAWPAIFLNYAAMRGQLSGDRVYLRFGDLPEGGESQYACYTLREEGVSVFHGYRTEDAYQIDARRLMLGTETRLVRHLLHQGRPLYVVGGEAMGMGASGEPILENAHIVRELSPEERIEVLPRRWEVEECVEWWRAKRTGADPGPFRYPILVDLSCDRSKAPRDVYADYGRVAPWEWKQKIEKTMRETFERWGLSEDYDRMQAQARRPKPPPDPLVRIQSANYWEESFWR